MRFVDFNSFDRRHFLVASATAAAAAVVASCTGTSKTSQMSTKQSAASTTTTTALATTTTTAAPIVGLGAAAPTAAQALHPIGAPGLMSEAVYQQRIDGYLKVATSVEQPTDTVGIASHLIRAAREPNYQWNIEAVTVESLKAAFDKIDTWDDTRDFQIMYMHWLLALGQGTTASTKLSPNLIDAIELRMVTNRYRYDDPLPADRVDNMWFWSENHRIIGLTNEYLAGQRFPTKTFTITGLTGAQHLARSRPGILDWINERAKLGFFEWHSNVYMLKNVSPLLTLVELADDPEIVTAAAMALDLCLIDMAAHNHAGCYTAPRGRTYKKDKMSSLDEDTFGTTKFIFDDTKAQYPSLADAGAAYLCAATRYRPAQLVIDIAKDQQTSVVRERHGVAFDDHSPIVDKPVAPYGKDFEDPANLPFWWSLGALGMWPMTRVSMATANKFRLWESTSFSDVKALALVTGGDVEKLRVWLQQRASAVNFGFLGEANTYAYREPKVSMASVIDHRFGSLRDQVHAWQAAIDEDAMVFTNHPVTDVKKTLDWADDGKPGYWTGEASMPRTAQHEGTAIHIYLPSWDQSTDPLVWSVLGYQPLTHAYVPQDHFDEVRQVGNWTIAAKAGAYIALWSWRTPTWRVYDPTVLATRGMKKPFDLVAAGGPDNVWISEVGTFENAAEFDKAVAALTAAPPLVERSTTGFTVAWTSPRAGAIAFGSKGPFTVAGKTQPIADFKRHESPWGSVDHESMKYALAAGASKWSADFDDLTRSVS